MLIIENSMVLYHDYHKGDNTMNIDLTNKTLSWEQWKSLFIGVCGNYDYPNLLEQCGEECWREYYNEEYTPELAFLENVNEM
jgi:hypothetical protein